MSDVTFKVVQGLNDILDIDPAALTALLGTRVQFKPEVMASEAPVIVGGTAEAPTLGPLGLLNGVLMAAGLDRVSAEIDQDGKILRFHRFSPPVRHG